MNCWCVGGGGARDKVQGWQPDQGGGGGGVGAGAGGGGGQGGGVHSSRRGLGECLLSGQHKLCLNNALTVTYDDLKFH